MRAKDFQKDPLSYLDQDMDRTYPTNTNGQAGMQKLMKPKPKTKAGGWRGNPNSLAALAAHRARTQIGGPESKRCEKCNRLAVRGTKVCQWHGAGPLLAKRKKEAGQPVTSRVKLAGKKLRALILEDKLPHDLLTNPLFQTAWSARSKDMTPGSGREEIAYRHACTFLCYELVRAYYLQVEGDARPWAECVRKARELGLG